MVSALMQHMRCLLAVCADVRGLLLRCIGCGLRLLGSDLGELAQRAVKVAHFQRPVVGARCRLGFANANIVKLLLHTNVAADALLLRTLDWA